MVSWDGGYFLSHTEKDWEGCKCMLGCSHEPNLISYRNFYHSSQSFALRRRNAENQTYGAQQFEVAHTFLSFSTGTFFI